MIMNIVILSKTLSDIPVPSLIRDANAQREQSKQPSSQRP
jgi:hypothetical protein